MRMPWVVAGAVAVFCPAVAPAAAIGAAAPAATVQRDGALRITLPHGPSLTADGLRLRTDAGWERAGRVVARHGRTVLLATSGGHRARVVVAPASHGSLRIDAWLEAPAPAVREITLAFRAAATERYYGFGERSTSVAQRATTIENYVSDGPFSANSRKVVRNTIPPVGFRDRDDATYYPVPWLLSSRGYGVLVANDQTSRFVLPGRRGGRWRAEVDAPVLRLRVFAGGTPARVLERFTAATGRQPVPPAPWAFGPWLQTGQGNAPPLDEQFADLEKLRKADAPVSAAETQLRYLPCGLDRGLEDYEARRVAHYHRLGLSVLTYVNPMLCKIYEPRFDQAAAAGALLKAPGGGPALVDSFVGGVGELGFSIQPVGIYDFTTRAGRAAYDEVVAKMLRTGHDGWMEDFGEYTPLTAVAADGTTGTALHNRYPVDYHCAVQRLTEGRPIVRFQRSGWTGAARCADIVWGGDPTTSFGFDGLRSVVTQALSMGLSGVSRWGSDIGGYDTILDDPKLTPELLKRWIEVGAVSAVMRMKKSGLAIPGYDRPQPWDPDVVDVWRRYTKLHTQLYPYLRAADHAYRQTGMPIMRALVLDDPGDRRAAAAEDEYRFGPDLLAAPVLREGARSRRVYLPRGRWLDGRAALRYDAAGDGAFHVGRTRAVRGGRTVTARAALDELPLYVRAGTILPMLTADVSTLSDEGGGKHAVRLKDRRDQLRLLAFPGPSRRATMFDGERLISRSAPGRWTLTIGGARTRTYRLEASTAGLRAARGDRAFRACAVRVGGRTLPRSAWRTDRAAQRLTATFRARHTTVTVTGCRR